MSGLNIKNHLMPEDNRFLKLRTNALPPKEKRLFWWEYQNQFRAGMDAEPDPNRKVNAGRRAANLWVLDNYESKE
jgi:hypothetical protein